MAWNARAAEQSGGESKDGNIHLINPLKWVTMSLNMIYLT
jgi:hypothetical protein